MFGGHDPISASLAVCQITVLDPHSSLNFLVNSPESPMPLVIVYFDADLVDVDIVTRGTVTKSYNPLFPLGVRIQQEDHLSKSFLHSHLGQSGFWLLRCCFSSFCGGCSTTIRFAHRQMSQGRFIHFGSPLVFNGCSWTATDRWLTTQYGYELNLCVNWLTHCSFFTRRPQTGGSVSRGRVHRSPLRPDRTHLGYRADGKSYGLGRAAGVPFQCPQRPVAMPLASPSLWRDRFARRRVREYTSRSRHRPQQRQAPRPQDNRPSANRLGPRSGGSLFFGSC